MAAERAEDPVLNEVHLAGRVGSEPEERELPSGDLVVTQDIPLAARVLANGAQAINPRGDRYTPDNIAERLSMRNFMDELRGAGVQTGGPAAFNARDRQAFASQLDRWIASRR